MFDGKSVTFSIDFVVIYVKTQVKSLPLYIEIFCNFQLWHLFINAARTSNFTDAAYKNILHTLLSAFNVFSIRKRFHLIIVLTSYLNPVIISYYDFYCLQAVVPILRLDSSRAITLMDIQLNERTTPSYLIPFNAPRSKPSHLPFD